jgi:hypothetical protein
MVIGVECALYRRVDEGAKLWLMCRKKQRARSWRCTWIKCSRFATMLKGRGGGSDVIALFLFLQDFPQVDRARLFSTSELDAVNSDCSQGDRKRFMNGR